MKRRGAAASLASIVLAFALFVSPAIAATGARQQGTAPLVPFNLELTGDVSGVEMSGVAVAGTTAFVAGSAGLRTFDITDPSAPSALATLPLGASAYDVVVSGTYAYVAAGSAGLKVVDVTNPSSPAVLGTWSDGYSITRVALDGSLAFLAGSRGVDIVDVSSPGAPAWRGRYSTPYPVRDVGAAHGDAFAVYSATGTQGLTTLPHGGGESVLLRLCVDNPAAPYKVNHHWIPGGSPSLAVADCAAYVGFDGGGWTGVKVFDIDGPDRLDYVKFYEPSCTTVKDVHASDCRLWIAGSDSIEVVAAHDLGNLYMLGYYPQGEGRVAAAGDLGVFTQPGRGLSLYSYNPVSERTAGKNRYHTSAELSKGMSSSEWVVLATGTTYPDAVCAAPLAFAKEAPILLVGRDGIPDDVAAEITRLGATKAVLLGGAAALGQGVVDDLAALGISGANVQRISGRDRFETSKAIALALKAELGGADIPEAFIATGLNFPDALAAGGAAAKMGAPILLVKPNSLPLATQQALTSLGCTETIVIGGTSAVGADVFQVLPSPQRLSGTTRYHTAVAIAEFGVSEPKIGFDVGNVFVVTGRNFPDALPCGVVAAMHNAPTVLVGTDVPSATDSFVTANKTAISTLRVVGGTSAISTTVERILVSLLQ